MLVDRNSNFGALSVHTVTPCIATKVVGEFQGNQVPIAIFFVLCRSLRLKAMQVLFVIDGAYSYGSAYLALKQSSCTHIATTGEA